MVDDARVYEAMQTDMPLKMYIKSQLGKVVVKILNPFDETPTELILEGNPRKYEKGCFVSLWTPRQVAYFERMNEGLIKTGIINEIKPRDYKELSSKEYYTNKDILELFDRSFLSFKAFVTNKYDIEFLERILKVAEDNDINKPAYTKLVVDRIELLASTAPQEVDITEDNSPRKNKKKSKKKKEE